MAEFEDFDPSNESYWRSIILFGRNVASYKFALGKSLLDLAAKKQAFISLEDLAAPFAGALAEHLKAADRQGVSASSRYLDEVRAYNRGELSQNGLIAQTVKLGFTNVIDAFHVVGEGELPRRFFIDERRGAKAKGIRLTDELFKLHEGVHRENLNAEVEARWRLVETAWELKLGRQLVSVSYDLSDGSLFTVRQNRRTNVTSCRNALNGYQKGHCFYCFRFISVMPGVRQMAEVDHFFPHVLSRFSIGDPIDGVWNLVLSCVECNRGQGGKFDSIPHVRLLGRLSKRNEFLISSHHPLRETLMMQTGRTTRQRHAFLQGVYNRAKELRVSQWSAGEEAEPRF